MTTVRWVSSWGVVKALKELEKCDCAVHTIVNRVPFWRLKWLRWLNWYLITAIALCIGFWTLILWLAWR